MEEAVMLIIYFFIHFVPPKNRQKNRQPLLLKQLTKTFYNHCNTLNKCNTISPDDQNKRTKFFQVQETNERRKACFLIIDEQTALANAVIEAVVNVANNAAQNNRLFYLEGAGGSGKTFTYSYLISELTGRGFQVGTAAFTGIAATLLKKGTTIHRLFRLPVPIVENSTCNITPVSAYAAELRQKSLFLLDEASMIPKHAFHAIDRHLQDICNNELPFGDKVVLLGGDFSQLLPVVRKGKATEIVDMCFKSSPLWHLVTEFRLTRNMRTRPGEQQFAAWLLQLGKVFYLFGSKNFSKVHLKDFHPENMASSVVLTPTNDDSLIINDQVLALLPGEEKFYFSADDVVCDDEEERIQYPVEFLNSITPSGMPPHCLKLKTGAIVMLLRNININNGLCNGTCLIIRRLHDNCVDVEVLTGNAIGDGVLIPRVQLAPSDTGMPFVLRRRQLPLRLSYAMTINKAQGQTFEKVGILLRRPCFSHGQLYVAFSRARAFGDVRVSVVPSSSRNSILCTLYLSAMLYKVQKVDVLEYLFWLFKIVIMPNICREVQSPMAYLHVLLDVLLWKWLLFHPNFILDNYILNSNTFGNDSADTKTHTNIFKETIFSKISVTVIPGRGHNSCY
ncbi:ATP-dependent DNA helicase PIF1-like [Hydractinia symbiolongicarpus]|uniref:ATP-dependent DNA helicase PIF1-like n=1 Tax=Hydractinia symbiolongicarpus TaxID=13093 RepID=UPI00254CAC68|nr:ATP-dependent DNA helicase PIF1-like [Hydractinia symbiolongicarpus]